eukprot:scaffold647803_cov17-Prasinocladus_malaysianus.AAC.1
MLNTDSCTVLDSPFKAKNNGYKQKSGKKGGSRRDDRKKKSGPKMDSRMRADQARCKKAMKLKKAAGKGKGKGKGKAGGGRK